MKPGHAIPLLIEILVVSIFSHGLPVMYWCRILRATSWKRFMINVSLGLSISKSSCMILIVNSRGQSHRDDCIPLDDLLVASQSAVREHDPTIPAG